MAEFDSLLAQVYCAFKPAVPVWVVLTDLAREKKRRSFSVKRDLLVRRSGVNRVTSISQAISVLERYGILARQVKRCRRPDGTMFRRLRIKILYQGAKSATILDVNQGAKSGSITEIHYQGSKSATIPQQFRGHQGAKSATLLREWRHVPHAATARDGAPSAVAPVAPSRAEHHVMIKVPERWAPMRDDLRALLIEVCAQVGCEPDEFMQVSADYLDLRDDTGRAKVRLELDARDKLPRAIFHCRDADLEPMTEPWTGSRDQVMLLRSMLERRRSPGGPRGSRT